MMSDVTRDEAYWAEVEEAVGTGTRSLLWGTSTRSLKRGLAKLRATMEEPTHYRTKSGRVLTNEDIEALAEEAERGYDVEQLARLARQKETGDAIILERAVRVIERRYPRQLATEPELAAVRTTLAHMAVQLREGWGQHVRG